MYRSTHEQQQRTKIRLAIAFVLAGVAVLAVLAWRQDFPDPVIWALFSAAFVYFSWQSVEVNDRLFASPSVMVVMTAAVAFGPDSAILGVAAMAALGPFAPEDFRDRRWFQPMVNFGQLIISASLSAAVLTLFLRWGTEWPSLSAAGLFWVAVGSATAAVVYGFVNYNLVHLIVRAVFRTKDLRPWSNLPAILLPLTGMGFLGGLLGAAYLLVGAAALPLIFVVFFVGYWAFESYGRLREAQESTLKGFIKALEAKDLYTRGHTERVAEFAEMIGRELGFNGTRLERLRWSALIHDVGKLAVPRELIRKRARLTDVEYEVMQQHVHYVEELLADVDFLRPMVDIAASHHAHYDGSGYHGPGHTHGEIPQREACILAVADSFDAMTSTRSYRVALTQEYAFDELRRHSGTQFDPEVVDAFITALGRTGRRYGSNEEITENEARRRAEQGVPEIRDSDQVHGPHFPVAPGGNRGGTTGTIHDG